MKALTRCVAIALAICLAGQPAWGHTFPAVRTVVIQVEGCEVALLIGYRPASGEATDTLLARVAAEPKSSMLAQAKSLMTHEATAPLVVTVNGKPLVRTSIRAKIAVDPSGTRPMIVVLATYAMPTAGQLAVTSRDPKVTRFSWTDRASHRVDLEHAPGQAKWFTGVASFLLTLTGPTGVSACAAPSISSD